MNIFKQRNIVKNLRPKMVGALILTASVLGWAIGSFSLSGFVSHAQADTQTLLQIPASQMSDSSSISNPNNLQSLALPYPTGSLVNDNGAIYFINKDIKIPFTNYQAFLGLGYSSVNVVKGDLSAYTPASSYKITTANMAHPWGTWLKNNGVIYYAHETGLIGVPLSQVFTSNGGSWAIAVQANKYDLAILKAHPGLAILTVNDARLYKLPVVDLSQQIGGFQFLDSLSSTSTVSNGFQFLDSLPLATSTPQATTTSSSLVSTSTQVSLTNPTPPQISAPTSLLAGNYNSFYAYSVDPKNYPLTYTFNFGDGASYVAVGSNLAGHAYTASGKYNLTVIADNGHGGSSTNVSILNVQ